MALLYARRVVWNMPGQPPCLAIVWTSWPTVGHKPLRRCRYIFIHLVWKNTIGLVARLGDSLTHMLLVANLAITKKCKKTEKWLKPWHMGTHLRVLCTIPQISTWQGLDDFQNLSVLVLWMKDASAAKGLRLFTCLPASLIGLREHQSLEGVDTWRRGLWW